MNLINPYCELIKKHFTQTIIRYIHRLMHTYRTFSILFKGTYQQSERRPTYICISSTHSAKKNFDRLLCDYEALQVSRTQGSSIYQSKV